MTAKAEVTLRGTITVAANSVGRADAMEAAFDLLSEALIGADDILADVVTSGSLATGEFEVTATINVEPVG